jgi:hypothetical protein
VVNVERATPLVTVIIPTHDHPATLDLALHSVLAQTFDALDVVVIGDGVGDDTRDVMATLDDPRIRFVDQAKSPSRAEPTRHRILAEASSPYACYLGDDDMMLADHVESMVALLQEVDFAHPLPLYIDLDGTFAVHPTDLSKPDYRHWHLNPDHNAVSLTGVAHRLDAYLRLPAGWREPPPGWHSDHYMWEQWFRTPGLRFATGPRLTVLKFEGSVRAGWTTDRCRAELVEWTSRTRDSDFPAWIQSHVLAALQESSSTYRLRYSDMLDVARSEQASREQVQSTLESTTAHLRYLEGELTDLHARHHEQQGVLLEVLDTRTWRMHDRVVASRLFQWAARRRNRKQAD